MINTSIENVVIERLNWLANINTTNRQNHIWKDCAKEACDLINLHAITNMKLIYGYIDAIPDNVIRDYIYANIK